MKNLNESVKSKGVVLFAFNTDQIDYVSIADANAKLITKNLQLPITLITDKNTVPDFNYDTVVRIENNKKNFRTINQENQQWRNHGRSLAYDLSPYDCTVLLDSDYLMVDKSLLKLLDQTFDYRLQHTSYSTEGILYNRMSNNFSVPFVWATCVIFNKTTKSQQFFELIKRIERNYNYYKALFNAQGTYRNDYVFAMADIILNGYVLNQNISIPMKIFTVENDIDAIEINNNFFVIRQNSSATVTPIQNLHIMDKKYLQSDNFKMLIERLCNELA